MPYYHVRSTETITQEFVVLAANRETAVELGIRAATTDIFDAEQAVRVRVDSDHSISVCNAKKDDWTAALNNQIEE
jgi:hypothetical protein